MLAPRTCPGCWCVPTAAASPGSSRFLRYEDLFESGYRFDHQRHADHLLDRSNHLTVFFGDEGETQIRIEDIAREVNLTTYVLMTAIGGRTRREFVED